jgi:hypothetical protein
LWILWRERHALPGFKDADAVKVAVLDTGVDTSHPRLKCQNDDYHQRNLDITAPVSHRTSSGTAPTSAALQPPLIRSDMSVKGICQCRLTVHKIFDASTIFASNLNIFSYIVTSVLYRRALAACVDNPSTLSI